MFVTASNCAGQNRIKRKVLDFRPTYGTAYLVDETGTQLARVDYMLSGGGYFRYETFGM